MRFGSLNRHGEGDPAALFRVLGGVVEEVDQDLDQAGGVGFQDDLFSWQQDAQLVGAGFDEGRVATVGPV